MTFTIQITIKGKLTEQLTVETEVTHLQDDAATKILLYLGRDANELATQCS